MKISHIIPIAAVTSSAIIIGTWYAPEITRAVFTASAMTVILSLFIWVIPQVIKDLKDN